MEFDTLVHQPTRLRIFAHLYTNGETSFTEIVDELDLTEGNVSSHLRKLEEADCVRVEKRFVDRTPETRYELTDDGRSKFETHVETLESLINRLDT